MIDDVRRALEVNRAAYDAIRDRFRGGMSEREAYEIVRETVDRICGDEPHEFQGDFVGGVRSAGIEGPATDLVLNDGDTLIIDLSVRRGKMWSDTCRTFFIGEPSARQRAAYETVLGCMQLGERVVHAGIVASSLKLAMEAHLVAHGFGGRMPHHGGHLVGPLPYMKPAFEGSCHDVLADGVVCTLEPGIYFDGEWGMRVENDYAVGPDGITNLFDYPREIEKFILKGSGK